MRTSSILLLLSILYIALAVSQNETSSTVASSTVASSSSSSEESSSSSSEEILIEAIAASIPVSEERGIGAGAIVGLVIGLLAACGFFYCGFWFTSGKQNDFENVRTVVTATLQPSASQEKKE